VVFPAENRTPNFTPAKNSKTKKWRFFAKSRFWTSAIFYHWTCCVNGLSWFIDVTEKANNGKKNCRFLCLLNPPNGTDILIFFPPKFWRARDGCLREFLDFSLTSKRKLWNLSNAISMFPVVLSFQKFSA